MSGHEVNNESETQAAKPPIRYVQMIRGMIADRVAERLGSDAFTMGVILIDHQDRLWWQPVKHYLSYLAELCGFPVVNPRRARAAVAALIKDGWLKRQRGQQGTHSQDSYEMMMKVELSPYQNGSDSQMTPNQNGIRHPTKTVALTFLIPLIPLQTLIHPLPPQGKCFSWGMGKHRSPKGNGR